MRLFFKITLYLIICVLFTVLTQIGGLVFLLSWFIYRRIIKKATAHFKPTLLIKILTFASLYLFVTFLLVPIIAKPFGRVPLPVFTTKHIRPVNVWTCILNRNYVRPELKSMFEKVAQTMHDRYEGTEIQYLDANLPFFDGFPLVPHLSHNDGRKLDLAFFYTDKRTGQKTNDKPSFSGYGVFEVPRPNELNSIETCLEKGYWQYDFNKYMAFGTQQEQLIFDEERTKAMIELFSEAPGIEKMFLEPHLKTRLQLNSNNTVRFHGCQAVRHDDHLHIQIRR